MLVGDPNYLKCYNA